MSSRKQFLQQSSKGLFSFLLLPGLASSMTANEDFKGMLVSDEEGEAYQWRDGTALVRIKISKANGAQAISFLSESFIPGDAIRVHKHTNEDELIFIHKGTGVFTLGEKEYPVQAGDVALVPKGVWHGLRNTGKKISKCGLLIPLQALKDTSGIWVLLSGNLSGREVQRKENQWN